VTYDGDADEGHDYNDVEHRSYITAWLMQLLNEERAKAGETPARHKNVLQATRTAMEKLGESARLNFQPSEYMDKNGQMRRLIQFSEDVIFPVTAAVGGKVEYQLLYRANLSSTASSGPRGWWLFSTMASSFPMVRVA